LCDQSGSPQLYLPTDPTVRAAGLQAAAVLGDFPAAAILSGGTPGQAGGVPAAAYAEALNGNWLAAAQKLDGQPRQAPSNSWGTVLYLAGQQAFQGGDTATGDRLLRQAEGLNGDDGPLLSPALADCLARWGRDQDSQAQLRRSAAALPPDQAALARLTAAF